MVDWYINALFDGLNKKEVLNAIFGSRLTLIHLGLGALNSDSMGGGRADYSSSLKI